MWHVRADDLPWQAVDSTRFTGQVVAARLRSSNGDDASAVAVRFEAAARTFWHSHPRGQLLWVLSGEAIVENANRVRVLAQAGDVVVAAPDELHWHGATSNGPMIHVSITAGEDASWTSRGVTDEQFGAY